MTCLPGSAPGAASVAADKKKSTGATAVLDVRFVVADTGFEPVSVP
jgi:hypothetical protein